MRRCEHACLGRKRPMRAIRNLNMLLGLVVVLPNMETRSKSSLKSGVCQIASNASLMSCPCGGGVVGKNRVYSKQRIARWKGERDRSVYVV